MQQKIYLLSAILFLGWCQLRAQVGMSFASQNVNCGDTFTIPATVTDFEGVSGFQFSVRWDTSQLTLDLDGTNEFIAGQLSSAPSLIISSAPDGFLQGLWFNSGQPSTLIDGDSLLLLTFQVVGNNFDTTFVEFSNAPLELEANQGGNTVTINPTNGAIILQDESLPEITCPDNQSATVETGETQVILNNLAPVASDNCGINTISYDFTGATTIDAPLPGNASGTAFEIGATTITYTATDFQGNTATCDFVVNIEDAAPVEQVTFTFNEINANCGSSLIVPVLTNGFDSITTLTADLMWDTTLMSFQGITNLNIPDLESMDFDTSEAGSGIVSVSWMGVTPVSLADNTIIFSLELLPIGEFSDANINITAEVERNQMDFPVNTDMGLINVSDTEAPTISCTGNLSAFIPLGQTSVAVNGLEAMVSDNCSDATITYELAGATIGTGEGVPTDVLFNAGTTIVTYTATDAAGLSSSCTTEITVEAGAAPEDFTLIAQSTTADCAADDIAIDIITGAFDTIAGTQFSVNWNPGILQFKSVDNVYYAADNADFDSLDVHQGRLGYGWFNAQALDPNQTLPDGTVLFTLHFAPVGSGISPVAFSDMPTPIEINAFRDGQFRELPEEEVVLTAGSVEVFDTTAPAIICPADTLLRVRTDQNGVVVNGLEPLVTDNCGFPSLSYTLNGATTGSGSGVVSGQTFELGNTSVIYTATDDSGNTQSCDFNVMIQVPNAIRLTALTPVVECVNAQYRVDIKVDSFENVRGLQFSVNWDSTVLGYSSLDSFALEELNETGNFNLDFSEEGKLGFAWIDDMGTGETLEDGTILFSIFYDIKGGVNSSTTVEFTDDPVFREGNVVVDGGFLAVPVIGSSGNLIIQDDIAPIITSPLTDTIYGYTAADTCVATVTWIPPQFEDECSDSLVITATHNPGDLFEIGQTTISYTATDISGNEVTTSALVIVRDTTAPTLMNCPADIVVTADENCLATATWIPPVASDACSDLVIVSATHLSGDTFPGGTTTVTYTAEDVYGNQAMCSFNVIVEGVAPITFDTFPANISVNAAQGQCGAAIGWIAPVINGGCDTLIVTATHEPGSFFPVGTTVVVYTATDLSGQIVADSFEITVIDNQQLVVTCPQDVVIQADGTILSDDINFINTVSSDTCGSFVLTFNQITAFDNCSPLTTTQTMGLASGSEFGFGETQMEFVTADTFGNSVTCSFRIIINDTGELSARLLDDPACAGSDVRLTVDTMQGGLYEWTGPNDYAFSGQNAIIENAAIQNSGDYIVKLTAENGCTIKDTISVGIRSAPEIEATANNILCSSDSDTLRLSAAVVNGIPVATYQWEGPGGFMAEGAVQEITDPTSANAGIYTVTATSANGCTDVDTVFVTVMGNLMTTLSSTAGSDTLCTGDSFMLLGTSFDGMVTYNWEAPTGAGLPAARDTNVLVVSPTSPGTYTYQFWADLEGGCVSDTSSVSVVVRQGVELSVSAEQPQINCATAMDSIRLFSQVSGEVVSYSWTGPNDFSSTVPNPVLLATAAASGTYQLAVQTEQGCVSTNSLNVTVTEELAVPGITSSSGGNSILCEGDNLTLTAEEQEGVTYTWTDGNGAFISNERVLGIFNITGGTYVYSLTVEKDGCTSPSAIAGPFSVLTDPVVVRDSVETPRNTSVTFNVVDNDQIIAGASYTITVISDAVEGTLVNNNDGTFTYTPITNFVGMDQIAYELCYTNCPALCDMATVTIRTKFPDGECFAPSIITPNGDGMNDLFEISCVANPPKEGSELVVFNEWGSEVFRESPYQNTWDGTYNGNELPDGTYYYIFKEDSDDTNPKRGYFTIFR